MPKPKQPTKLVVFPKPVDTSTASPHLRYAESFRCISSACEDTCCNGWTIPVDRRTVQSYRAHPTLAPFSQLLILNTENPSSGDYARMPLTHSGNCAFLNPEKLCAIHQHFGPELLSVACNTYPRETSYQFGHPETALNLSCPEAARITLLNPCMLDSWRVLPLAGRLTAGIHPTRAVRDFLLRLLLERSHPLWHRVALMGELCQQIPSFDWAKDNRSAVTNLLHQTTALVARPAPHSQPALQNEITFVTAVLASRVSEPTVSLRFRECIREFLAGFFPTGDASVQIPVASQQSAFLAANPHFIENYLANHIIKYSYPFGHNGDQTPTDAHLYLAGLYCLIQTLLLGMEAHQGAAFDLQHAIKLIQSFSRAIEHRAISRDEIVRLAQTHHIGEPTAIHLVATRTSLRSRSAKVSSVRAVDSHKLALCQSRS